MNEWRLVMKERLVHRGMRYRCATCGYETMMWLEEGLEDRESAEKKPVPYIIRCPKCGEVFKGMRHVDFHKDVFLKNRVPLDLVMNRFENRKKSDCGVPVFAEV